ncbi:MAG: NAD(P) transhydrogenase subunit alpha [Haloferacaceae archaeon]
MTTIEAVIGNLTLFVLAAFVGYEVITKIPTNLHTPLMSGSNAISGITLIGSVAVAGAGSTTLATWLGFAAVVMASINVVGGYLVSHLMLQDFHQGG